MCLSLQIYLVYSFNQSILTFPFLEPYDQASKRFNITFVFVFLKIYSIILISIAD